MTMRKLAAWSCALVSIVLLAGCAAAPSSQYGASGPAPTSLLSAATSSTSGPNPPTTTDADSGSSTASSSTVSATSSTGSTSTTAPTDPLADQTEANKKAATAEAQRLLDSVHLPSGSGPSASDSALGPAVGTPSATSLIDLIGYHRRPLSLSALMAWIKKNPPTGTKLSAWSGGVEGYPLSGLAFIPTGTSNPSGGSSPGVWSNAQVSISAADRGSGTVLRIDAQVIWLDPHPLPDIVEKGQHRLALTVAGGCPPNDGNAVGVDDPHASTVRLLPPGRPTGALICDYGGGNSANGFQLYKTVKLDKAAAAQLAAKVAAIPLAHSVGAEWSCPAGDGSSDFIAFSYPGGTTALLDRSNNGCWTLANGRIEVFMTDLSTLNLPPGPPLKY